MNIGEQGFEVYAARAIERPRRVEKANPSSALLERDKGVTRTRMVSAAAADAGEMSQGETPTRTQSPNFGQSCGFMAQIIGQVLRANRADWAHAARIYDTSHAQAHAAPPHVVASL